MPHFHRRVRVGSFRKGAVRVAFPPPKSRRDQDWAALSCTCLAVLLRWGTETPERVPATAGKFELHTPSVDWSTESAVPCDRGIITNKHSTRWTAKALFIEENVAKVCRPSWTSYVVALCCLCAFFFIGFISGLHCRAAMRSRCLRSCCGYRRPA